MSGLLNGSWALILSLTKLRRKLFLKEKFNFILYCIVFWCGYMPVHFHKHLGFILDSQMNYIKHIDGKIAKDNQGVGFIKHFINNYLTREAFLQIYKSFPPTFGLVL